MAGLSFAVAASTKLKTQSVEVLLVQRWPICLLPAAWKTSIAAISGMGGGECRGVSWATRENQIQKFGMLRMFAFV